jgi:hypothetical protein
MIIPAASLIAEIFGALGVAVAAAAMVSTGMVVLAHRQRDHIFAIARADVDAIAMRLAAQRAQEDRSEIIKDMLRTAVGDVAKDQDLPDGLVRGAIFSWTNDRSITIVDDLAVNYEGDNAYIQFLPGETDVGDVFSSHSPVVTVFDDSASEAAGQYAERRKVINTPVRWIIALPIGLADGDPLWALSVDGLVESRSEEQLESSVARLLYYRELLELLLKGLARSSHGD